jgi:hypothetical protein
MAKDEGTIGRLAASLWGDRWQPLSRLLKRRIDTAARRLRAGDTEAGLAALEALLPRLRDPNLRLTALKHLLWGRVMRARGLQAAGEAAMAAGEIGLVAERLKLETESGPLSVAKRLALLDRAATLLARYQARHRWATALRGASPEAARPRKGALSQLETLIEARSSKLAADDARAVVATVAAKEDLPAVWWLVAHGRLYRLGLVGAAVEAKRAAARAVLSGVPDGGEARTMQLAAAAHIGDRDRVEALTAGTPASRQRRDALLALGDIAAARALDEGLRGRADRRLAESLAGKTVAIVGPAPNTLASGPAIDAHDAVARTNFIPSEGFRAAEAMLGRRTTLAYYNSMFMRTHEAGIVAALKAGAVDSVALRSPAERLRMRWLTRGQGARPYHFSHAVFMARGFAMRHILNDLLLLPVAGVTCYGADFYLGDVGTFAGYNRHNPDLTRSYIVHDPLDCWLFMRRMQDAGLLKADAVLSRILALGEDGFIEALGARVARP